MSARRRTALVISLVTALGLGAGLALGAMDRRAADGREASWLAGEAIVLPLPDLLHTAPDARSVALVRRHGQGLARWLEADLAGHDFGSSHPLFQEEWAFGTLQMAALGYASLAAADPDQRDLHLARMERCLDGMLAPAGRAFDRRQWGRDALAATDTHRGHAAWLGYTGLALARHRQLAGPDTRFSAPTAQVLAALRTRFRASDVGVPETYPGERYPVDAAAGIAALAVAATAADTTDPLVEEWLAVKLPELRHARTGLLLQAVDAGGGAVDGPRGSGTLLAAWFLGQAELPVARELSESAEAELAVSILGFGSMREYPWAHPGRGDIDSGPILFGQGVSATGFGLGVALQQCRTAEAQARFRTAEAFGGPVDHDGTRHYRNGGPIGDAILFAMLASGLGRCDGSDPAPLRSSAVPPAGSGD